MAATGTVAVSLDLRRDLTDDEGELVELTGPRSTAAGPKRDRCAHDGSGCPGRGWAALRGVNRYHLTGGPCAELVALDAARRRWVEEPVSMPSAEEPGRGPGRRRPVATSHDETGLPPLCTGTAPTWEHVRAPARHGHRTPARRVARTSGTSPFCTYPVGYHRDEAGPATRSESGELGPGVAEEPGLAEDGRLGAGAPGGPSASTRASSGGGGAGGEREDLPCEASAATRYHLAVRAVS